MTPYYDDGQITIYCGDCRDILPAIAIPPNALVITDPPYGIGYDASHSKYKNGKDYGEADWDNTPYDPAPIISLGLPSIIWGANCFASRLPDSPSWLVWLKVTRQDARIRQADMELAWTNCVPRPRTFHHLWIGAYRDSESGKTNLHPTQKPEALMRWCIDIGPNVETIIDPYCGSGTTLRAAKDRGRGAIGIELNEDYCATAVRRLSQSVLPLI